MKYYSDLTRLLFRLTIPVAALALLLVIAAIWAPDGFWQQRLGGSAALFVVISTALVMWTGFEASEDSGNQRELKALYKERHSIQDTRRD
jgi:uncharacterized membrane protein YqjE